MTVNCSIQIFFNTISCGGSIVDQKPPAVIPLDPHQRSCGRHASCPLPQPLSEHGGCARSRPCWPNTRMAQRATFAQVRLPTSPGKTFSELCCSSYANLPSTLRSHPAFPAPSPFVLHRDCSWYAPIHWVLPWHLLLGGPELTTFIWQILGQLSNTVFVRNT